MSQPVEVRRSLPAPTQGQRLLRWMCTSNPFYVISAGLFLAGLWLSFGEHAEDVESLALMFGLVAYTALLTATAWLLARFGNVWDDVRTVLLLIVLMFLATSVTFDALLVLKPLQGYIYSAIGLLLAIVISEVLLQGTGLKLPTAFRVPYHLILALFFLYPLALAPYLEHDRPPSEAVMWGLFSFSPVAGLVFLSLIPAIRRGSAYVNRLGNPWRWPLFPWTLFGLLALAVPARAFLLCWSMHLARHADLFQLMFGLFFLVPFGLACMVLLLEIGIVGRNRFVQNCALMLASSLLLLTLLDRPDKVYHEFQNIFISRLGGDPLFVSLLGLLGFYAYASLRRVAGAVDWFAFVLGALAFVGPHSLKDHLRDTPSLWPLLAFILLQLGLGMYTHRLGRCLLAGAGLVILVATSLPSTWPSMTRLAVNYHHIMLLLLVLGGYFRDTTVGRCGVALAMSAFLIVMFLGGEILPPGSQIWIKPYLPMLASCVLAYGLWTRTKAEIILGGSAVCLGMTAFFWGFYRGLRQSVVGLDHIVLGLSFFALALAVSLWKSGRLHDWLAGRAGILPSLITIPTEEDEDPVDGSDE